MLAVMSNKTQKRPDKAQSKTLALEILRFLEMTIVYDLCYEWALSHAGRPKVYKKTKRIPVQVHIY